MQLHIQTIRRNHKTLEASGTLSKAASHDAISDHTVEIISRYPATSTLSLTDPTLSLRSRKPGLTWRCHEAQSSFAPPAGDGHHARGS